MNSYELPPPTPAALRHERARQEQQRTASALRASEAMASLVRSMGGQAEAADALGISKAAVSKTVLRRKSAANGVPGVPLADYLEIDLPRCGGQVPTLEEWRALPADEQSAAAERSHRVWSAIHATVSLMAAQAYAAGEWTAEAAVLGDADGAPRPALVSELAPGLGEPSIDVLADIADSLASRREEAWRAATYWRELAHPSETAD
ncbi:hypothetical protein [Streptomyces sp. NPDC087538]|uniref:hypothetical protein n=1 Tax=Streptomyces sp. NPDC087538 TaxID=3365797 RepID=UPI0037FF2A2F